MLIMWFFSHKSLPNLLFGVLCLPVDQSHQVCATDNKPSCVLHLLDWFTGFFLLGTKARILGLSQNVNRLVPKGTIADSHKQPPRN